MAITTNKKNKILADFKTGKFSSISSLANHYKVDRKTVKKITEGISASNADIVEVGVLFENAKKSLKNPIEIKAVENAIKERTVADEIESVIFEGTLINVKGIKKDLGKEGADISMFDRKTAQEAFDKALVTSGKANRHAPKIDINNTNAQQNNDKVIKVEYS